MCFSATASFVAGGVLSAAGGVTLNQTTSKKELPFASIPLLFGVQQFIEGLVWLSFDYPPLNSVATYAYLAFSHVLWPIFTPVALLLIETDPLRKKILRRLSFLGFALGAYLLYFILTDTVSSQMVDQSIAYHSTELYPLVTMFLYLVTTCGSCFVPSHKIVKIFGVVLTLSFFISLWFFRATFLSVWCFFAALLSALVYIYLRKAKQANG